jgi:hypothetical protein
MPNTDPTKWKARHWVGLLLAGSIGGLTTGVVLNASNRWSSLLVNSDTFGAAIGAFLAILGAVGIEEYRRRRDRNSDYGLIRDSLVDLRDAMDQLIAEGAEEPNLPARQREILDAIDYLADARALLAFARENATIKDVLVWKRLRAIEQYIDENETMLDRETHIIKQAVPTARVVEIYVSNMTSFVKSLRPMLTITIDELRRA